MGARIRPGFLGWGGVIAAVAAILLCGWFLGTNRYSPLVHPTLAVRPPADVLSLPVGVPSKVMMAIDNTGREAAQYCELWWRDENISETIAISNVFDVPAHGTATVVATVQFSTYALDQTATTGMIPVAIYVDCRNGASSRLHTAIKATR